MPTDTSEKGLETRTINLLLESGWLPGDNHDYQPASFVDLAQLAAFLHNTQPETAQALNLDSDDNTRRQFLNRLKNEIQNRGIIDVLRNGIEHGQHSIRLFYGTPSPGNEAAATLHAKNRFSVTRQVHYSTRNPGLSLDLVLFINGLPLITFELKNNLTKQTVEDAVEQYRTSRDPRNSDGNPDSPQAVVFLTSIIDVTVGLLKRITDTIIPHKTGIRLLGVARNPANGFPPDL